MEKAEKPTGRKATGAGAPGDKFSVVVHLPDRASLAELRRHKRLDVEHIHTMKGEHVEVALFATKQQIADLREAGWKLDVGKNLSAIGRERQKEVGKGDRYQGGKKTPKGLGTKTRGEA
jgi:hypothetical protein